MLPQDLLRSAPPRLHVRYVEGKKAKARHALASEQADNGRGFKHWPQHSRVSPKLRSHMHVRKAGFLVAERVSLTFLLVGEGASIGDDILRRADHIGLTHSHELQRSPLGGARGPARMHPSTRCAGNY